MLIDTAEDKVVGRIPVAQPHNSAIAADGRAYVGSQLQDKTAIVIIDVASRTQLGVVPLDKTPRALDVSPDGKWLYFTLAGSNAVQVLDTASRQRVAEIPVGASPHLALFTSDGRTGLVVLRSTIMDPFLTAPPPAPDHVAGFLGALRRAAEAAFSEAPSARSDRPRSHGSER